MITATYKNTPVQVIEMTDARRRTFRVKALEGQPFKAWSRAASLSSVMGWC